MALANEQIMRANRTKLTVYQWVDFAASLVAASLFLRFVLIIADPTFTTVPQAEDVQIYVILRGAINTLYSVTRFFMLPLTQVLDLLSSVTGFFPGSDALKTESSTFGEWLKLALASLPQWMKATIPQYVFSDNAKSWLPGFFEWTALVSGFAYLYLRLAVTEIYSAAEEFIHAQNVDRIYKKHLAERYKAALAKKNKELEVFKSQSVTLKTEISDLATSVVRDELTGTYNRRFFSEKVASAFKAAKKSTSWFTIMMVDIDHFKSVNDTYGHIFGDETLVKVAGVNLQSTEHVKGYPCRYGGEEFALILENMNRERAMALAESIRRAILNIRYAQQPDMKTTASIGFASINFSEQKAFKTLKTYEEVLKMADDALYHAKQTGRNRVVEAQL